MIGQQRVILVCYLQGWLVTFGQVTTLWSVCCECDAVTRNWLRARQYITTLRQEELWNECTGAIESGRLTERII